MQDKVTTPRCRARHDFREGADKQASRLFNLEALTGSLYLADQGERLWLDWLELAGEQPPTIELLTPLLGVGRFIGVDDKHEVIARNEACGWPHTAWHCGRLQNLLVDRPYLFDRVGILNYDSLAGWHTDSIISETTPLIEFAARQLERVGEFVLIVNAELTRNVARPVAMARAQSVYAPLLAPLERQIEAEDVFYYRASGGRSTMMNVRIRLGFV